MLTKANLRVLAQQRMREAEVLLEAGLWSGACYLAGYAVELGLKAVVASRFKADEIPDRGFVNGIYTHNLATLITHAELKVALDVELTRDVGFARNWEHVKNWSEDARTNSGPKNRQRHWSPPSMTETAEYSDGYRRTGRRRRCRLAEDR